MRLLTKKLEIREMDGLDQWFLTFYESKIQLRV